LVKEKNAIYERVKLNKRETNQYCEYKDLHDKMIRRPECNTFSYTKKDKTPVATVNLGKCKTLSAGGKIVGKTPTTKVSKIM
jgi:hypothetical protein